MSNPKIPVAGTPDAVVYVPVFVPKFFTCQNCNNGMRIETMNCFNDPAEAQHAAEAAHDAAFPLCQLRSLIILWDLGVVATRPENNKIITPDSPRIH